MTVDQTTRTRPVRSDYRAHAAAIGGIGLRARVEGLRVTLTTKRIRFVAAIAIVVGFVLAVVAAAATNAYTSDDVFVQNVLDSLLAGEPFAPIVGGDNFALKVPLYLLVGAVLPNGPVALTATVLAVNAPLVVALLVVAGRVSAGRGRLATVAAHLLVAWFLMSRIAPMSSLMIPNGRNGEIGVAVLIGLWWCRPLVSRRAFAVCTVALALLFFSDGFFLYVVVPACLLLVVVSWIARTAYLGRIIRIGGAAVVAALLAMALGRIAEAAGLEVLQNYANTLPAAGDLPAFVAASAGALARDLNGDAAGQVLGTGALPALLQVVLLVVLAAGTVAMVAGGRAKHDLAVALGLSVLLVNVGLYIGTSNAADPYSFRYVLFAAVVLLLLGVRSVGELDRRGLLRTRVVRVAAVCALVAVVLGLAGNVRTTAQLLTGRLPDPQARVAEVIAAAENGAAPVGVGDYWDANITTYMSSGAVRVVPMDCTSGTMKRRAWLINRAEVERTAGRMFVVIRSAGPCTEAVVRKTYGLPASRTALSTPGDAVWIYDRTLR